MIQDIFPHKLYNSYDAAAEPTPDSYVLSFHQAQVLLKQDDSLPQVSDMGQSDYRFLFRIDDHSYFLPNEHFPETENFTYHSVRAVRGNESIPKHQRYAFPSESGYTLLRLLRQSAASCRNTACHGMRQLSKTFLPTDYASCDRRCDS